MHETTATNKLFELATQNVVAKLVVLAAELKFNKLLTNNAKPIVKLAKELHLHPTAMLRILRVLDAYGVVKIINEDSVAATKLTPYLDRLLSPHIVNCYRILESLPYSLKTNKSCWDREFGKSFYDYLQEYPEKTSLFANWCTKMSAKLSAALDIYDFSKFDTIVDVGGGQGHFLKMLLSQNPKQHGILFDRPNVIKHIDNIDNRIKLTTGNFFKHIPKGGDAYILCRTLINWNNEDSIKILNNCFLAMKQDGKLIIIDFFIPAKSSPNYKYGTLNDLLSFAIMGGSVRSKKEWSKLIKHSKFNQSTFYENNKSKSLTPICVIEVQK